MVMPLLIVSRVMKFSIMLLYISVIICLNYNNILFCEENRESYRLCSSFNRIIIVLIPVKNAEYCQ